MKKILTILAGMALCLAINNITHAAPLQSIIVRDFVLTAPTSPSNSFSLQNSMDYMDKGGVVGLISTNTGSDPAALNMPHILRVSDFIYSAANYYMHDATNNPTGNFATQNGGRIGWGLDWKNSTPFLASDIYFSINSDDPANSLHYVGNIATNTSGGAVLTFSSTLRGELWDASGKPIAWYYNGEDVASHPVNSVICLIREGYYASDPSITPLDLNYFKGHMPMSACVQFYMLNGQSGGLCLSSKPWLQGTGYNAAGYGTFNLEGQRQLGMTYTIEGVPQNLDKPIIWNNLFTDLVDGFSFVGSYYPNGFFRVMEGNVVIPPQNLSFASKAALIPSVQISNGSE